MIEFLCTVQEGCIPENMRPELEKAIQNTSVEILGIAKGPFSISWAEIPRDFGFRGGKPTTTSHVRGQIPDGCDKETRERLMKEIGERWYDITGQTDDELIVAARDEGWKGNTIKSN